MTSKERAALRAQANTIETTLIVGKGGVSEQVLQEASNLLDAHELIKGKVLETAMLTAREAQRRDLRGARRRGHRLRGDEVYRLAQVGKAGAGEKDGGEARRSQASEEAERQL